MVGGSWFIVINNQQPTKMCHARNGLIELFGRRFALSGEDVILNPVFKPPKKVYGVITTEKRLIMSG